MDLYLTIGHVSLAYRPQLLRLASRILNHRANLSFQFQILHLQSPDLVFRCHRAELSKSLHPRITTFVMSINLMYVLPIDLSVLLHVYYKGTIPTQSSKFDTPRVEYSRFFNGLTLAEPKAEEGYLLHTYL